VTSISFDRAADIYDATRGYTPAVADAIGAAVFAAAGDRPGTRMLEIGIGTGRIALPILARGADVVGVDVSPRMLERLAANFAERRTAEPDRPWGQLDARLCDITALPFPDASFDAAIVVHVLHLVSAWRTALDEVLRVIRPGGVFLIGNDRAPGTVYSRLRGKWNTIVQELGADLTPPGAAGYEPVLDELRARGLTGEATTPVTWTERHRPRQIIDDIARRTWSGTWSVPDDILAMSITRLEAWAERELGPDFETPIDERAEFMLARFQLPT
jgi:ubiquinone/menaquinone biosynthesis C-methylase UbiE